MAINNSTVLARFYCFINTPLVYFRSLPTFNCLYSFGCLLILRQSEINQLCTINPKF